MPLFGRRLFHLNEDELKEDNQQQQQHIYTIEHTGETFSNQQLYEKQRRRRKKPDDIYIYTHSHKMKNNYYNINYTGFGIERIDTNKAENVFLPERPNTNLHT